MGGHNRAEARARSSGEIAGRAFGRQAAPDGAKRQRAVLGERGRSEREALPTPYSRSDGGRPAALPPRAPAVERRECPRRKPADDSRQISRLAPMGGTPVKSQCPEMGRSSRPGEACSASCAAGVAPEVGKSRHADLVGQRLNLLHRIVPPSGKRIETWHRTPRRCRKSNAICRDGRQFRDWQFSTPTIRAASPASP